MLTVNDLTARFPTRSGGIFGGIIVEVLAINTFGDFLRDVFNPRLG